MIMPVIELDVERLCRFIGREIEGERLAETLSAMGTQVEEFDGGHITLELFPNRPDMLSIEGVARALRAYLGVEKGLKRYELEKPGAEMMVDSSVLPIRGCVQCLAVRDVSLDDASLRELMELQEDLHWALGRDRRKVAIGVHDPSHLSPPYRYLAAGAREKSFVPLGLSEELSLNEVLELHPKGQEYGGIIRSFDRYPLIVDAEDRVLSMPPIINAELTRVSPETTELFVEMTGVDERAVTKAMNILATAFGERGWRLSQVLVRYPGRELVTPQLAPEKKKVSLAYVSRMLGMELGGEELKHCLERMGYGVSCEGDELTVEVPSYRADVLHEIDIVEDVAIGYGYGRLIPELPPLPTRGERLASTVRAEKARSAMIGLGFTEVVTLMLTNDEKNSRGMRVSEPAVRIKNPISEEHTIVRTHLLPGLLEVLYLNRHRELPQRIFEVGAVLSLDRDSETGARVESRLAACIIHGKANFSEVKSVFTALARDLDLDYELTRAEHPSFIPGRCAGVEGMGYFGELHPEVLASFNLEYPAAALELRLA